MLVITFRLKKVPNLSPQGQSRSPGRAGAGYFQSLPRPVSALYTSETLYSNGAV